MNSPVSPAFPSALHRVQLDLRELVEVAPAVDRDRGLAARARSAWCITIPNPAEQSLNAGQKTGTPLRWALSRIDSFSGWFFSRYAPNAASNCRLEYAPGSSESKTALVVSSQTRSSSSSM
jgi:hypothetical protein